MSLVIIQNIQTNNLETSSKLELGPSKLNFGN